jgi:hypothetical protein
LFGSPHAPLTKHSVFGSTLVQVSEFADAVQSRVQVPWSCDALPV